MDIVERLRDGSSMYDADDVDLHLDAVDEIERLREEVEHLHKMTVKWSVLQVEGSQEIQRLRKENEQLRSQMDLFDPSTTQEMAAAALNFANDEIKRLQEKNHALRKANKRLGEIATDAVEWLPPASVNGPREYYQKEIKELIE